MCADRRENWIELKTVSIRPDEISTEISKYYLIPRRHVNQMNPFDYQL